MMFNARRLKMTRFGSSTLCVVATLVGSLQIATGQMINATVQTASPRVVASRSAPATAAKPVTNGRMAPQIIARPVGVPAQRFNSNLPRTIAQPATNLRPNYSAGVGISNPAFAALNVQRSGPGHQTIAVDPATRQTELRTLAAMRQRRGLVNREPTMLNPATRQTELRTLAAMRERRVFGTNAQTVATIDAQRHVTTHDPTAGPQPDRRESPKDMQGKKGHNKKDHISFNDAFGRHWHEWHDRNWWHNHCDTIVLVTTGYYFLDGSYWYPAWGYDPLQTYYDYDGPIYTYSDLLPDEVIANVQTALQDAGYYYGPISGSLSIDTRAAIANFQRDYGLQITGAIDEATVEALGLYQSDAYQSGDVLDSSY
jgi:putative peptidoglycan binding protein